MQTDMFSDEEIKVRSFPPHLDPARVDAVEIDEEEDRDHVAEPVNGVLPIGALGSNRRLHVVRIYAKDNSLLHAESFTIRGCAISYADEIRRTLNQNRQIEML